MTNSSDTAALTSAVSVTQKTFGRLPALFPYIVSLWLIVMTGWYAMTAVHSLHHPLNMGDDLYWARLWAGLAIAVVLSYLIPRRRLITLIWLGGIIAVALSMIVLSHQAIAALITAWLLLLSWLWGDWLLRRLHVVSEKLDRAVVAIPLGLAFMSLLALALCMVRLLTPKWAWLIFSAITLVQYRSIIRISRTLLASVRSRNFSGPTQGLPEFGIIVVFLGFVFLLDLSWSLAPEIHSDALAAHLPVAQYYVEHRVAFIYYGYIANLVNFLYAIALSLHGQIVAKLLVLASGVISAVGTYVLGRILFSARVGLWAAALFYSTPLVSWLSTTVFIDAPVTMFLLSTTLAFLQWRESRQSGLLWAAGLLTGASIAAKLNALLGLPVIGLVLLWDLIRSNLPRLERLKSLGRYVFGACLVAGPGWVLCYVLSGNPFFPIPILSKLFSTPKGPAESLISNAAKFGIGSSPLTVLKLPFAFTFETQRFGEAMPPGGLGLALVLAPLALISLAAGGKVARRVGILLAITAVYLLCLTFIMQYARYYIPVVPVVAVLALQPIFDLSKAKWLRRLSLVTLGFVVILQIALTPLMYWNIGERFPLRLAFGLESRDSFLERALPMYRPVQFVNGHIEPGRKVLMVGGEEGGRTYLKPPVGIPYDDRVRQIAAASTPDTLAANLINDGFSHLLIHADSYQNRMLALPYTRKYFLSRFTVLEYSASHISVYRLRAVGVEPPIPSDLLANPGFEALSPSGFPKDWTPTGQPLISQAGGQSHNGKIAVRADGNDWLNTRVPIEAEKVYSLGYWCRSDKPNQFARLQINWLNNSLQVVDRSIEVILAQPKWGWHQSTVMSPPGATLAEIYVSVHENSEVWFDDYKFVPGELLPKP